MIKSPVPNRTTAIKNFGIYQYANSLRGKEGGGARGGGPGRGMCGAKEHRKPTWYFSETSGKGVNRANAGKWERGGIYGVGEEGPGGQQNHKFKTKEEYENERTKQELQQHH